LILSPKSPKNRKSLEKLAEFIKSQVNALELKILDVGEKPEEVEVLVKPVYERLGPRLRSGLREVEERLRMLGEDRVRSELERSGRLKLILSDGRSVELTEEDLSFEEALPENLAKIDGRFADIYIDLSETRDIAAQSLAREVIRRIQVMRKELDLVISDYIDAVIIAPDEEDLKLLDEVREYIREEVRAKNLTIALGAEKRIERAYEKTWNIGGKEFRMIIAKSGG